MSISVGFSCARGWLGNAGFGMLIVACFVASTVRAESSIPEDALDCLIEPWVVSSIGSPLPGVISTLLVDRGERVKRGQPIAKLESGVESATVELAKARATMRSEIAAREAELNLAKVEMSRFDDLHKQKMVPAQQRDESVARYQIASAALVQALENNRLQLLELHRSQEEYARKTLQSPVDGVVVAVKAFAGEFIYDNPVMTIASLDPLRVEVMLPARLFGSVSVGDSANLYPELGDDDQPLTASVDVVDPLLDTRSGTFGVRLVLPNAEHVIPAGQRCRVEFDSGIRSKVGEFAESFRDD